MSEARILVVDDEEPIREVLCTMLQSASYQAVPAANGVEALDLLRASADFQLVLSDLMMPELDGLGLLEVVKLQYPFVPFVMVTAVHDVSIAVSAMRSGAYDYLLKPFEREQLLALVRRAFEANQLRVQNHLYQTSLEALVDQRTRELRETIRELEHSYDITLEALGNALDLKDAETEGHSKRVTAFSIQIAHAMGLDEDTIRTIARGAFLHDIGKMAIPDAILRKPAKLTETEMALMRQHAELGYRIVSKIPFLSAAAEIIYAHQEFYDGSGYPRGLRGEQIPLGARIFAVADTLDAITSNRPYRKARSLAEARQEIANWSGRQFDPAIVEIFMRLPDALWNELRQPGESQMALLSYAERPAQV